MIRWFTALMAVVMLASGAVALPAAPASALADTQCAGATDKNADTAKANYGRDCGQPFLQHSDYTCGYIAGQGYQCTGPKKAESSSGGQAGNRSDGTCAGATDKDPNTAKANYGRDCGQPFLQHSDYTCGYIAGQGYECTGPQKAGGDSDASTPAATAPTRPAIISVNPSQFYTGQRYNSVVVRMPSSGHDVKIFRTSSGEERHIASIEAPNNVYNDESGQPGDTYRVIGFSETTGLYSDWSQPVTASALPSKPSIASVLRTKFWNGDHYNRITVRVPSGAAGVTIYRQRGDGNERVVKRHLDAPNNVFNDVSGQIGDTYRVTAYNFAGPNAVESEKSTAKTVVAPPQVFDNLIWWLDDGYYMVKSLATNRVHCYGKSHCQVPPGLYQVYNYTTGASVRVTVEEPADITIDHITVDGKVKTVFNTKHGSFVVSESHPQPDAQSSSQSDGDTVWVNYNPQRYDSPEQQSQLGHITLFEHEVGPDGQIGDLVSVSHYGERITAEEWRDRNERFIDGIESIGTNYPASKPITLLQVVYSLWTKIRDEWGGGGSETGGDGGGLEFNSPENNWGWGNHPQGEFGGTPTVNTGGDGGGGGPTPTTPDPPKHTCSEGGHFASDGGC